MCFKLTNTELNRVVAHRLFNNTFQNLCSIGKAINASDADICYFSVVLFSLFTDIVIWRFRVRMGQTRHVKLVGACGL